MNPNPNQHHHQVAASQDGINNNLINQSNKQSNDEHILNHQMASTKLNDPISVEIAQLSKAELIAQLQQARRDAQRTSQTNNHVTTKSINSSNSNPSSEVIPNASSNVDHEVLMREMQQIKELLASKVDVITAHAAATAALAQQQKSSIELEQEIAALQQAIESERLRKEHLQTQHQMEVQSLRAKLEADRLEKENAARLLAARIAQVKMEIQELKTAYRRTKQRSNDRASRISEENAQENAKQEAHLSLLKQKRDAMERQQRDAHQSDQSASSANSPRSNDESKSPSSNPADPPRPLKSFTLDHAADNNFTWPGSPSNAWCEPELCIRHVLRLDSSFRIVTQPDHRRVRLKSQPFAQGGMRLAYVCEDLTAQSATGVVYRLVAKESMYSGNRYNSLPAFYGEVRAQLVARAFAQRFNRLNPPKFIQFLAPMIYEFPQRADPDRRYMCVELFLSGEYKKYSDNFSFVNANYRTIPAFCHWSWHDSAQQMMITDLQGVGYILTDPQIHSTHGQQGSSSGSFGAGGGDASAMLDFFKQHQCNEICYSFQLSPHPAQPRISPTLDTGVTRAHLQYATEMMGECGHMFVLQVKDRPAYLEAQSRMLCPTCVKNPNAVPFFPKER